MSDNGNNDLVEFLSCNWSLLVIIVMLMVLTTARMVSFFEALKIFLGKESWLTLIWWKKVVACWRLALKEIFQLVV